MVVLSDSVLVSRVMIVFFGSIGSDGTVDRRTGSKGGRGGEGGEGGGAVSTGRPIEYSFNDEGYEALTVCGGDGIGRGTWGRGIRGGGLIAGLVGDFGESRDRSGRGGKGGLVGGKGQWFREEE